MTLPRSQLCAVATVLLGSSASVAFAQADVHTTAPDAFTALVTEDGASYQPPASNFPWDRMNGIQRAQFGADLYSPARFLTLSARRDLPITLDFFAPQASSYGMGTEDALFGDPLEGLLRPIRNLDQYLYEAMSTSTNIYYTLVIQGLSRTIDDANGDPYGRVSGTGRLDVNLQTVFAKSAGLGTSTMQVLMRSGVVIGQPESYSAGIAAGSYYNLCALSMGDETTLNILSYSQGFLDDRLVFTAGKLHPNQFFLLNYIANDESAQFLNGSLDGNDVMQPAQGTYCPGAVMQTIPRDDIYVNAGIFDIADGPMDAFENIGEGLYCAAVEIGWTPKLSTQFSRFSATFAVSNQGREWNINGSKQTNAMCALLAQHQFDNGFAPFLEYGIGSEENPSASQELTLGVGFFRPFGRVSDYAGVGWSCTQPTNAYGTLAPTADPPSTSVLEAFYRLQLTESMQLSPDFQINFDAQNGTGSPSVAVALRLKTQF